MIAIPNMDKPKSCDECQILRAEFDGSYDKPITGCRQKMGKKNTLREEYDALILDCPLIEIIPCKECKNSHMTYDGKCKYCDWEKDDDDNYIECYFDGDHFCSYAERK